MKNYEEMARDVFQRIDEYETEKRAKRAKITKVAASVTPVCAAAVVGVGLWKGGVLTTDHDQLISNTVDSSASDVILSADNDTSSGDNSVKDRNHVVTNEAPTTSAFTKADQQIAMVDTVISDETEGDAVMTESNISDNSDDPISNHQEAAISDISPSTIYEPQEVTEATAVQTVAPVQQTTPPVQQTEPATQDNPDNSGNFSGQGNGWYIAISTLEWNGITYNDNETVDVSAYSRDKYIGKVSEFGGDHQNNISYRVNPDNDVYTTKENAYVLLVVKADGTVIAMTNPAYLDGVVFATEYEEVPYDEVQIYNGGFQAIN